MSNNDKGASHWLLMALFGIMWSGGTLLFENLGLLGKDQAWLASGVIAAVLVFCIPERGKARDLRALITCLVFVVGFYAIFLEWRPLLAIQIGGSLAALVCILLGVVLAALLWLFTASRSRIPT